MSSLSSAPSFDHLLLGLAQWVLAGCALWAGLILVAALVEASTRGRVVATSWVATPPSVRRLLLAGIGVALVGGSPGPVSAAALPVPARPLGLVAAPAVVVGPGDSLWRLAAARLPATASAHDVASAAHRWYARNRTVIGPDPDLIRPGQRLRPPRGADQASGPRP